MSDAAATTTSEPVCPRHPSRISYIRCQRCDRPTCTDCQVAAPVGFQCVDCVREQRRTNPAARTALGARVGSGRPVATYAVLGVLITVFVGQLLSPLVTETLAFSPFVSRQEPWRFLTVGLVHSPGFPLHILLNGLMLWQIGREAEAVMGRWRYLAVLALSTIGGSAAVLWLTPTTSDSWFGATVGISGAVFGLFGAFLAIEAAKRRPIGRQLATILVFALLGIVVPSISWQSHVGGLVGGLMAGAVLALAPRAKRLTWQVVGLAAVLVVLLALVAIRWVVVDGCLAVPGPGGGYFIPSCG